MWGLMFALLQFAVAIQVSYNASGTTILYVELVLAKALTFARAGTAVASEKSTTSRAVQPLNAFVSPLFVETFDNLDNFTVFNDVQFWNAH